MSFFQNLYNLYNFISKYPFLLKMGAQSTASAYPKSQVRGSEQDYLLLARRIHKNPIPVSISTRRVFYVDGKPYGEEGVVVAKYLPISERANREREYLKRFSGWLSPILFMSNIIKEEVMELIIECGSANLLQIQRSDSFYDQQCKAEGVIRDIFEALYALEGEEVAHCDIKPENIVYISRDSDHEEEKGYKLLDFGLAQQLVTIPKLYQKSYLYGTKGYISPEFINGKQHPQPDIFSFGMLCYWIVAGQLPTWTQASMKRYVMTIKTGAWKNEQNYAINCLRKRINPNIAHLISLCTAPSEDRPLSFDDIGQLISKTI